MTERKVITAVLGTYRKGGVVDAVVDEILAAAQARGAETARIYLIDRRIGFCTNCRTCTQQEGQSRGPCPLDDEMDGLLDAIADSDAIVLASPMNFGTVTAVTKRFIERLVCFAYWPWGKGAPRVRNSRKDKRAVIVVSSAAPAIIARLMTRMAGLLKGAAGLLGAKTVGVLFVGRAASRPEPVLRERTRRKARRLGARLVP